MVMTAVGGVLMAGAALFAVASVRRGSAGTMIPAVRVGDLFEAGPDALLVVDRNGAILAANRLAETLFGWPRAELIGQPVERLMPQGLRQRAWATSRNDRENPPRTRGGERLTMCAGSQVGFVAAGIVVMHPAAADNSSDNQWRSWLP